MLNLQDPNIGLIIHVFIIKYFTNALQVLIVYKSANIYRYIVIIVIPETFMKSILIKSPLVFCALINLRLTKNHWENLDCVHYLNHTKPEYKGRVEF